MSNAKWTAEQLTAITTRDCNLLVAAAAGAGKTAVLVERLIRRITDQAQPVDVDRLLVVTFTKAAAAEMRERIGSALARELNQQPGSRHLHRQVTLLNKAAITTLHSFCLEVLKQYFYRLDLDPIFRVADDTEAALLRLEALEELFEARYLDGAENFLSLVDAYGGNRDDSVLQEIVLELANFAFSNPWPEHWLQKMTTDYSPGAEVAIDSLAWTQSILKYLELQLQGCRAKLERALQLASEPGGPEVYQQNLQADIMEVAALQQAAASWQTLYQAFRGLEFSKLKSCRDKDVDDYLKERVKDIRNEVKKQVTSIEAEFFSRTPSDLLADLRQLAPLVATLAELVQDFGQRYQQLKKAKGLVDFADLEHYCLAILLEPGSTPAALLPSAVAYELREQFEEVLVDEYQDTNAVQETILQLISRQGSAQPNLFMVGDVKQSIYRFRLAEPGLFMAKYQSFPRAVGQSSRGVDLAKNFRSRQGLVDGVNFLFRQLMTPRVGEMAYDQQAELVCGAEFLQGVEELRTAEGPIELYVLEKKPAELELDEIGLAEQEPEGTGTDGELESITATSAVGIEQSLEDLDVAQREARVVAHRIQQMVKGSGGQFGPAFNVLDKASGSYRPVQYHDIVILMRATKGVANTFLDELRQAGIPAYADLGTGYFQATEVETMLALLKVIDNPRQDIPLAAVLRSSIVEISAEELAQVRLFAQGGDFYKALWCAAQSGEFPQLEQFLKQLEHWRTLARQGSLADLIWRLYMDTGYYAYVGTLAGGVQRQANLRALHDRARQYEATSFRGLFRFLRFIEKFQESGKDLGTARALGEKEDVVRIISIHKSKGLEFPVVFVTGMGKQFNTNDLRRTAILHKELGLGLPLVDTELRITYPSLAQVAIKKRLQLEALAEELRILYVALTRAREKLIMVGSVNDVAKCAVRWCENVGLTGWQLPDADLAAAKHFLDWVAPAIARHQEGEYIRRLAGLTVVPASTEVQSDPSNWMVYSLKAEECSALGAQLTESAQTAALAVKPQAELLSKLADLEPLSSNLPDIEPSQLNSRAKEEAFNADLLNWQYPWSAWAVKPAKATVTELKRRFSASEAAANGETVSEVSGLSGANAAPTVRKAQLLSRPRFIQETTGLSAAEKGSAMHLVMQHLQLDGDLSPAGLKTQVARLELAELLTPEQAENVDIVAITAFFRDPLGQRLTGKALVKRELPFTLALPASQVYPELAAGAVAPAEQLLVQGVIDCLLDEGDGLVLIDYKTDQVYGRGVEQLVENYQGQLNLYAHALEVILKRPVKEKYLYLFAVGKAVRIE